MTWSVQLTLWALPPILALLLAARDVTFLWPRHREAGTPSLLGLTAAIGIWAFLDLVSVTGVTLGVKLGAVRVEYLPAAAAAVAWLWFALAFAGRRADLRRWPSVVFAAVALATALAAFLPGGLSWFVREARLVPVGRSVGLSLHHGIAHWTVEGIRLGAVVAATWVVSKNLAWVPRMGRRIPLAVLAAAAALAPPIVQLARWPGAEWADLSSLGYALASSLLVWGVARPRILNLGPVDRDLVLDELTDPIIVMDGHGHIVDANGAAEDVGLKVYGDVPLALGTLWAKGPGPEGSPAPCVLLAAEDGQLRTFEVRLTRLGKKEAPGRSALLLRDVTLRERIRRDLERANADLDRLARTDPLTGLANRRHFMESLEREADRCQRYLRPMSIVLLDLDHFKSVNDTHGHAAGDDVLRETAVVLRSVCRDVDLAARLGGEELALLLPETEASGAGVVAERVRERIATAPHRSPAGQTFQVTASLGVATALSSWDGEALLQAADEALYRAKAEGRDRVVVAT